jgi:conjugal transfer pilus assembly protein TraB
MSNSNENSQNELKNFAVETISKFQKLDKQKKTSIIFITILLGIFLMYESCSPKKPKIKKEKENTGKQYSLGKDTVKAQDKWMIEESKKVGVLENQLADLKNEKEELMRMMQDMQNSISAMNENLSQGSHPRVNQNDPFANFSNNYDNKNNQYEVVYSKSITTHNINLQNKSKSNSSFYKKTKNYIPQGAYARGILISAVDAGVGTSSQANPRPVLIRLSGEAISSSLKGEKERTDVSGCVITAGAEGDISSERVYIKLSRMTCTRKKGEAFEVNVKGYVSGFGKAGIRGVVVSRDWDKLSKAFAAGLISGFGSSYSQSLQPPAALTTNGIVLTQQQSLGNAAKSGVGKGIEKSGDMLADYYIKRAEQYQPVISLPAGIEIEVVFLEGVSLVPEVENKKEVQNNNQVIL